MSGHITREDVARVRDSMRECAAAWAKVQGNYRDGAAYAYGMAAKWLDDLLGEDTSEGAGASRTRPSGGKDFPPSSSAPTAATTAAGADDLTRRST